MTPVQRLRRFALIAAGMLCLALAMAGVVLPGLPTTPFVLLAAAWLLNHRYLGPMLRDWEAHRSLPLRVKQLSTSLMAAMVALSVWQFTGKPWLQLLLLGLGMTGAWVVWCIPTRPAQKNNNEPTAPKCRKHR